MPMPFFLVSFQTLVLTSSVHIPFPWLLLNSPSFRFVYVFFSSPFDHFLLFSLIVSPRRSMALFRISSAEALSLAVLLEIFSDSLSWSSFRFLISLAKFQMHFARIDPSS